MSFIIQPWQLFLLSLSGWIDRHQQHTIEYLIAENQVLKEKLGKKRILLNDDQRRRLAVKYKLLGRKLLSEIASIVTPDTILSWHRQLVAEKLDYSDRETKRPGRPISANLAIRTGFLSPQVRRIRFALNVKKFSNVP